MSFILKNLKQADAILNSKCSKYLEDQVDGDLF